MPAAVLLMRWCCWNKINFWQFSSNGCETHESSPPEWQKPIQIVEICG